jgi:DNA-binding transcriptional ArsR family regulator
MISPFVSPLGIAEIGALLGDPARAAMLSALMSGRALTAGELAYQAGVTAQTASGHLSKLTQQGLLSVTKQGRHRYFRLASREIGTMLEGVTLVAALHAPPRHRPRSAADEALRFARTCYDHLAGTLGVLLTDALTEAGHIELGEEGGSVTHSGENFLSELGLDLAELHRQKRHFCRPCLDWSERRMHLAGALGAALTKHCLSDGWLVRHRDSRAVAVTPKGRRALAERFAIELSPTPGARDRNG